jgi:hypothetical protein
VCDDVIIYLTQFKFFPCRRYRVIEKERERETGRERERWGEKRGGGGD